MEICVTWKLSMIIDVLLEMMKDSESVSVMLVMLTSFKVREVMFTKERKGMKFYWKLSEDTEKFWMVRLMRLEKRSCVSR
jgi:hypothetical protein